MLVCKEDSISDVQNDFDDFLQNFQTNNLRYPQ